MSDAPAAGMRRRSRLRSPADFARVYATGTRARMGSVVAIAAVGNGPTPRVGISCSRRVGGAVRRNRAKRRLREAIRPHMAALRPGAQVILQAGPDTALVSFQKLADEVGAALLEAGALDA